MPWRDKTVEDLRKEFVLSAEQTKNFSALCREFGITRRTGYKWFNRYKKGQSLTDKSKKPNNIANRTPRKTEKLITDLRTHNPGWGAKTLKKVLENQGHEDIPCVKTVNNILNRYGCISEEESLKHKPYQRFEKSQCNELWQTDFKGEFLTADDKYCFPLDILDDHSRFLIKIKPHLNTVNVVISTFEAAFEEYGMPRAILSDNGRQFSGLKHGFTQFEKWLMNLDILPIHGRIKHPQTQGKIERFHRTLNNELLKHTVFKDINDADEKLQIWRDKYNNIRPHEALNMKCPSEVYVPSNRTYTGKIENFAYGGQFHVVKVNSWGYVRFGGWQVYLSETMINEYIEFRPSHNGKSFIACYRNYKIAEFDAQTGQLIHRKISRM